MKIIPLTLTGLLATAAPADALGIPRKIITGRDS